MGFWKKPTHEQVDKAVALLVQVEHYRYFFDRLENPEWLEPLWERGFFKRPPEPIQEEGGRVFYPLWHEAKYLARMAKHKPDLVAEIIQQMGATDNSFVIHDLLDALLAVPSDVSVRLVEKVELWARFPEGWLADKVGQLINRWAKEGQVKEALRVVRTLLEVLPRERNGEVVLSAGFRRRPEVVARFDEWQYEKILKEYYPQLVEAGGMDALQVLCELLEKAIDVKQGRESAPDDNSYIWRPAIEDHEQNWNSRLWDVLVVAIRDSAERIIQSGQATIEEAVNFLEQRRWKVFQRIALHLLRVFCEQAETLAMERLMNRALLEDFQVHHEYALLLREYFPSLSQEAQATILGWIEAAPDEEGYRRQAEATGAVPSDEEIISYREIWQLQLLAWIGRENLPPEWQARYQTLVERHGEIPHPEFLVYNTGIIVGPISPKSVDELKAMSVAEIVEFLRGWVPPEGIFGTPTPEGLGRVLADAVVDAPERFALEARRFQGLGPTYVRHLLFGLWESLRQNKSFDWAPVLDLCQWVVEQPREIEGRRVKPTEADPDWGPTRGVIADLLADGSVSLPIQFRDQVWRILKPLTQDPDPTPEDESRYLSSNWDTATRSINTVRGKAMHAVVRYALWVRRYIESQPDAESRLSRGFDEMPEVREVLEAHLDVVQEPSLSVRAVYGWWFPWLALLDLEWAWAHTVRIFPTNPGEEAFFDSAWITYLAFCEPYNQMLEVLREQYRYAIDRIGSHHDDTRLPANPDHRLAEHLMVFYWRGLLSPDDLLFTTFWEKAPVSLRGHALRFIGQALRRTEEAIPPEILERLKNLWEMRLENAKSAQQSLDHMHEMAAFGWWFVSDKFDRDWAMAQLLESLRLAKRTDPDHWVLEHLIRTVKTHPVQSVQCLKIIVEECREMWTLYAGEEEIRQILSVALQNPNTRKTAEGIVHYLGSRGFLEFRELLGQ